MKKKQYYIGLLLLVLTMIGCGTVQKNKMKKEFVSLEGTSWQLAESVKGTTPTLNVKEGVVSGNAGCNTYSTDVEINSTTGQINTGMIRVTRMVCRDMQAENSFLEMLKKSDHYTVENDILKLYQNKVLLLKFKRK